ncbi:MAG: SDR family NAD(P)-dependent oxidoreductase, partial [Massilia sp.]
MKVIIITGASDGIGAEMARQLAHKQGAGVALVLAARNVPMLDAVAAECAAFGAQTLAVATDVGVQDQCKHLISETVARFGRIDALINNAGR